MDQSIELHAQIGLASLEVSLKIKPVITVIGGGDAPGWQMAINHLAERLTRGESRQYQQMIGHAWWAQRTSNISLYATAQARLIDLKLLTMVEEAWQPENRGKVYLAYLHDISSGELSGLLTQLAYQLRRGGIIRLPTIHLETPIPFPSNLLVAATIAPSQQLRMHDELFRVSAAIDWLAYAEQFGVDQLPIAPIQTDTVSDFLTNRILNPRQALLKLKQIAVNTQLLFLPIMRVVRWLKSYDIDLPSTGIADILLFLANAWTTDGMGVFSVSPQANAATALDIALAQFVLTRIKIMGEVKTTMWRGLSNLLKETEKNWPLSKRICQRQL